MVDELNQEENLVEVAGSGQGVVSDTRVAELESLLAQQDEELRGAKAHLVELEQALASRESDIASLKQSNVDLEARVGIINTSLAQAVASYRAMAVRANPEVIEELITGDTVESINESLSQAKTLVSKVKQGLATEISRLRVPAGAPERTSPDLGALSPREKIQYAIGGKS